VTLGIADGIDQKDHNFFVITVCGGELSMSKSSSALVSWRVICGVASGAIKTAYASLTCKLPTMQTAHAVWRYEVVVYKSSLV
jgi:hypothetical protein